MKETNKIFVFEMGKAIKIVDLAERMITMSGYIPNVDINIEFIGLRPGEKLYEEALSSEEDAVATHHKKIKIAKVRDYKFDEIVYYLKKIESLSGNIKIDDTVKLMKFLLPEFKSKNSAFSKFDLS